MSEYEGILDSLERLHEKLDMMLAWRSLLSSALEDSGGEKPKMSDDEIMRFNEEIMAKVNEREVQPLKELPEVRIHSPGFENYKPKKEEVDMDFSKVTVMNQTPKALLVVKKGLQQWLALQFIKEPLDSYDNGVIYDIELKEKSNAGKPISWVLKKWVPFEVFKN